METTHDAIHTAQDTHYGATPILMESHTRLDSYGRAWHITSEQLNFELLWERVQSDGFDAIIGAIYHPPKPVYSATDLLCHIESCLETSQR